MRRFQLAVAACAAVLLFTAPAGAQTIGFKLGASLSNLSATGEEFDQLKGFAGGGFIRFGTGRIGLQAELLTVTKGAELEEFGEAAKLQLEYVEIPVLLHVPLTLGSSFAPYIFAGPSVAFEVGCDSEGVDHLLNCDEERKSTDYGLQAGGGLAVALGPGALLLEGRYSWGLAKLDEDELHDLKTRAAYLMVGYSIPLVRR